MKCVVWIKYGMIVDMERDGDWLKTDMRNFKWKGNDSTTLRLSINQADLLLAAASAFMMRPDSDGIPIVFDNGASCIL